ncbi:MAG: SDR family oxidoreductase [Micromonosporaceae bacterium]
MSAIRPRVTQAHVAGVAAAAEATSRPRVALITGGSGGIGRAVVEKLGAAGMAVAVAYGGRKDRAQDAVDAVIAAGGQAILIAGDYRTNVRGAFVVSQQAARRIRDGGAIINFSSSVVKIALPDYAAYAATKGAVDAMTLILAREMRGRDVTVNTVAPGPTATPLFLDGKPQEVIDNMKQMSPLQRLGEPADIAETVAHLAGPARWINGQVIYVNGGVS